MSLQDMIYSAKSYAGNSELPSTATLLTTVFILLLSIPTTRSFLLRIIYLPYNAIKVLSNAYEERESEVDDTIRDDDESAPRENQHASSIFFHVWTVILDKSKQIIELMNSITGFRLGFGGRLIFGDLEVDNDRRVDGSWRRSKAAALHGNSRRKMHNIAMPLGDKQVSEHGKEHTAKVSFDINSLEPTFLHEEDYPSDWMEYDPIKGSLVRRKDRICGSKGDQNMQAVETSESNTLNDATESNALIHSS